MHLDRRFVSWGLFLVAVGAVPLAARAGLVAPDVRWLELWPLLLVGWGVGLILGRTRAALLGSAIVALTLGAIVGGFLAAGSGFGWFGTACNGPGTTFATQSGTFSTGSARVVLDPGCGTLDVTAGGGTWEVAGSSRDGRVPAIDSGPGDLVVRAQDGGFDLFGPAGGTHWQVNLPSGPELDLTVTADAGRANLAVAAGTVRSAAITVNAGSVVADLSNPGLTSLSVTANAGSAKLILPAANLTGSLTANAGTIGICVPPGTTVRIRSANVLGGNNFEERGLIRSGDTWASPGFESASSRIDLSATANVGSVDLDPDGGCR